LSGSVTGVLAALPSCFIFNAIVIVGNFVEFYSEDGTWTVTMVPFHHGKVKAKNRD
jgi:hypothetical protein